MCRRDLLVGSQHCASCLQAEASGRDQLMQRLVLNVHSSVTLVQHWRTKNTSRRCTWRKHGGRLGGSESTDRRARLSDFFVFYIVGCVLIFAICFRCMYSAHANEQVDELKCRINRSLRTDLNWNVLPDFTPIFCSSIYMLYVYWGLLTLGRHRMQRLFPWWRRCLCMNKSYICDVPDTTPSTITITNVPNMKQNNYDK